jgi:hypothetical protein
MVAKKVCFVVMGFGKKTDYSDVPRTLDLDRTYEAIIEPAVTRAGLDCIRADQISHAGIIDKPMYEMLLRADLVIADISTANPNALYELGVRHALRPFSTIVIKELDGKFIFDLNHLATLQYKHLGEDIGSREASLKSAKLHELIQAVLSKQEPDSPVYTYLAGLSVPTMTSSAFKHAVAEAKVQSDSMAFALEQARSATQRGDSAGARDAFRRAYDLQLRGHGQDSLILGLAHELPAQGRPCQSDPYLVQQLALHTYKAKQPSEVAALYEADRILQPLDPRSSTDPETLGICGAIQKRLFKCTGELASLDMAIDMYGRGFVLKQDYYNGENYALCLNWRADQQQQPEEAAYDRRTAQKARERVVASLTHALQDEHAAQRSDFFWMLASMANTLRALGLPAGDYEEQFRALVKEPWQLQTFEQGKAYAEQIAASAPQAASALIKSVQDAAAQAQKAAGAVVRQLLGQ